MMVGYARVSTQEQHLARKEASLAQAGCEKIFKDKASGKDFDRPEWQRLCSFVREGDCVVVHDLSRLGRNAGQIKDEWEKLMRRHVDIRILNMPILDTRRYQKIEGVGQLIVQLVFELLSWQAEEERRRIRTAQREGIARAKESGKYRGRPRRYSLQSVGADRLVYDRVVELLRQQVPIQRIA